MYTKAFAMAAAFLVFNSVPILAAPIGDSAANVTNIDATQETTRSIDCKAWKTPQSCDIFCFATLCEGLPSKLHHMTDKGMQNTNRKESGASLSPFSDDGLKKYHTWRRPGNPTFHWGDEYPLASSHEGGNGVAGSGRAIVQGAQQDEQQQQAQWANKIWDGIPEAAAVTLSVHNWDPKLSPYCDAWKKHDKSVCKGKPFYNGNSPYFRLDDGNNGPNGAKTFTHLGM